jgi:hypothetical protein
MVELMTTRDWINGECQPNPETRQALEAMGFTEKALRIVSNLLAMLEEELPRYGCAVKIPAIIDEALRRNREAQALLEQIFSGPSIRSMPSDYANPNEVQTEVMNLLRLRARQREDWEEILGEKESDL